MGSGSNPPIKPDLFSALESPDISLPPRSEPKPLRKDEPAAAASPSYALPTNLPSALRHLDDDQLGRLLAAVISELKRRGKKLPVSVEPSRKRRIKEVAPPLSSRETERCPRCLQSWCHTVTDCSGVRNFSVGCEKGASERWEAALSE
jgi:hypothetical protein